MFQYRRENGEVVEFLKRLTVEVDANLGQFRHPETGETLQRIYSAPMLITPTTRSAGKERTKKAIASDPLYTSLPEYKPQVEQLREKHEAAGNQVGPKKIKVYT